MICSIFLSHRGCKKKQSKRNANWGDFAACGREKPKDFEESNMLRRVDQNFQQTDESLFWSKSCGGLPPDFESELFEMELRGFAPLSFFIEKVM